MSGRVHLPLVDCQPYSVRLTVRSCVERFELASGLVVDARTGRKRGQGSWRKREGIGQCQGCQVGARRRAELRASTTPASDGRPEHVHRVESTNAPALSGETREAAPPEERPPLDLEGPVPSRRWCSPPVAAPAPRTNEEHHDEPRARRGAPIPRPSSEDAIAWAERVRADRAALERLLALVLGIVHGPPSAKRHAAAAFWRRVGGLTLGEVIAELGSPPGLDEALVGGWVHRGRWVIGRALRQGVLGGFAPELEAVVCELTAIMGAARSDAGLPRPAARGPRAHDEEPAASEPLPLLEALEGAQGAA